MRGACRATCIDARATAAESGNSDRSECTRTVTDVSLRHTHTHAGERDSMTTSCTRAHTPERRYKALRARLRAHPFRVPTRDVARVRPVPVRHITAGNYVRHWRRGHQDGRPYGKHETWARRATHATIRSDIAAQGTRAAPLRSRGSSTRFTLRACRAYASSRCSHSCATGAGCGLRRRVRARADGRAPTAWAPMRMWLMRS